MHFLNGEQRALIGSMRLNGWRRLAQNDPVQAELISLGLAKANPARRRLEITEAGKAVRRMFRRAH